MHVQYSKKYKKKQFKGFFSQQQHTDIKQAPLCIDAGITLFKVRR